MDGLYLSCCRVTVPYGQTYDCKKCNRPIHVAEEDLSDYINAAGEVVHFKEQVMAAREREIAEKLYRNPYTIIEFVKDESKFKILYYMVEDTKEREIVFDRASFKSLSSAQNWWRRERSGPWCLPGTDQVVHDDEVPIRNEAVFQLLWDKLEASFFNTTVINILIESQNKLLQHGQNVTTAEG